MGDGDKRPSEQITRVEAAGPRKPAPEPKDEHLGSVLGKRYRVLSKLGEGGMGAVYLAEHVHIEKRVAIKILSNRHSRELSQRFAQEAKSASKIGHENIIDITDFGETADGAPFLVMEHLQGSDLGQRIRSSGPLPLPRAARIMYQVCRALAAAHKKGIVHRDLKPDNVFLVEREGNPDFVKVLDFGLARVTTVEAGSRITRSGSILGTPGYMAPEQVRGDRVDERADVYAAGCMLYELLTGDIPFNGGNYMVVLQKHLVNPPEPPSKRRPELDGAVDAVVITAMAKEPERRFQSMKDLALALCAATGDDAREAWGSDPLRETPTVHTPPSASVPPRSNAALWLGGVAGVVLLGAVLWWSRTPPAPVTAAPVAAAPVTATPAAAAPTAATPAAEPPAVQNHITIASIPSDADVERDGATIGRTPFRLILPATTPPFDVQLLRHGYKDSSLKVEPDRNRQYVLTLTAIHKARPAEPAAPAKAPAPDKPNKISPELKDVFSD